MKLIHGGGKLFRDLGYPDEEVRHAKDLLAAEIIKVLEGQSIPDAQ